MPAYDYDVLVGSFLRSSRLDDCASTTSHRLGERV